MSLSSSATVSLLREGHKAELTATKKKTTTKMNLLPIEREVLIGALENHIEYLEGQLFDEPPMSSEEEADLAACKAALEKVKKDEPFVFDPFEQYASISCLGAWIENQEESCWNPDEDKEEWASLKAAQALLEKLLKRF